jgi:hypothetical protein
MATLRRTVPTTACPHTPSTAVSPRPPQSATAHPVTQSTWKSSEPRNTSTQPHTAGILLPPWPPPVISTRGKQTLTSATVNRSYMNLEYGMSMSIFLPWLDDSWKYAVH